jgi:caffeoyl-CoA O-methyltransferase
MELVNAWVEVYADNITSANNELLQQIQQQTLATHDHAHMLCSPVQGKILTFLSTMLQPKYVLEIGTFTGYSALCLAEGLTNKGELHTIELRAADAATAKQNFSFSPHRQKLILHTGNALEIIPALNYKWDLVFIDADKTSYIDYYEIILPRLSESGIIIADNVLFHGQIFEEPVKNKNAKAMLAFNNHVKADIRTEQVLLTVRDGLLLIKKK